MQIRISESLREFSEKELWPIRFAAEELRKYLLRMGAPDISLTLSVDPELMAGPGEQSTETVAYDPKLDDRYRVRVRRTGTESADTPDLSGSITGNNPRAVLLGAYRYLSLIGCRFLKPGLENEWIPYSPDPDTYAAEDYVEAALRHRGACLEGANSIDDILRFIDWSPKVGYNSFFFQFELPKTFLERYYLHIANPLMKPEKVTMEDAKRLMMLFDEELQRRGLLQHRVGHGWTSKVLGAKQTGWESSDEVFDEETTALMAQVNGKRELWGGIPTNTNLCLSNPLAREKFVAAVMAYLRKTPSVDYLHIWLADDRNNSCECENCRKKRPSDWYIVLLNELDEAMTKENITAKLVMLLYVDLLWEPLMDKIKNPERFLLMFAPITRSFKNSFADYDPEKLPEEPPFVLNRLTFPKDVETNLTFLKAWQEKAFIKPTFDCFDYDYYMGRAHYGDPTYVRIARTIDGDMKNHKKFGLNGYNSCQELRSQFPNGLANFVLATAAVDPSVPFEERAKVYYRDCYGEEGPALFEKMSELSYCFDPNYVMCQTPRKDPEYHKRLEKAAALIDQIEEVTPADPFLNPQQVRHWALLDKWILYARIYTRMMLHTTAEEISLAQKVYEEEYMPMIRGLEREDPSLLDVYRLDNIIGRTIRWSR
ncbi:MAG: DUF4838 domain-containing protein [Firmicutes bacterium]|nr:DUF4838 domain-containing protein [Bacillota bacterium]